MGGFSDDLLPIYIVAESVRQFSEYYAFNTTSGITPPFPLLVSEVFKLLFAATYIFLHERETHIERVSNVNGKRVSAFLRYSLPAALDTVGTAVYVVALGLTSPNLLRVVTLTKVPLTLLLHHFWVKRARIPYAWSCVLYLSVGLILFKVPPLKGEGVKHWFVALPLGLVFACFSAASNISSETLMKSGELWQSQLYIYVNGVIFSILSFPITLTIQTWAHSQHGAQAPQHISEINLTAAFIFTTATTLAGLSVTVMWRERNTTVKVMGEVISLLVATTMLYYAQISLREENMTVFTSWGGLIAGVAIWGYNKFKEPSSNESESFQEIQSTVIYEVLSHEDMIQASDCAMSEEQDEEAQKKILDESSPVVLKPTLPMMEIPLSIARKSIFACIKDALTFGIFSDCVVTLDSLKSNVICALISLLPSFIFSQREATKKTLHPTAYLDGLRGVAGSGVYIYHTAITFYPRLKVGWTGTDQRLFFQLPWIRWFFSGHSMVATFFVISGFSLSLGPLRRIRSDDMAGFSTNLASSMFRRWMRLFIPAATITFIDMSMIALSKDGLRGMPKRPFFIDQFWEWFRDFVNMSNPLKALDSAADWLFMGSYYEGALWTIPIEFRGSIIVFCFLIGCARLHPSTRMTFIFLCAATCLYWVLWDVFLFLMGIILAEIHLINRMKASDAELQVQLPQHQEPSEKGTRAWCKFYLANLDWRPSSILSVKNLKIAFWIANFLLATYILSIQGDVLYAIGQGAYGYTFIWSLTPSQFFHERFFFRFWPAIGSVYLIWTLDHSPLLQRLFTNRLTNYLSRVSYSIYLVHPPILFLFTIPFTNWIWSFTGTDTDLKYTGGFMLASLIVVPINYWAADLFTRFVDENAVRFSKWWYGQALKLKLA